MILNTSNVVCFYIYTVWYTLEYVLSNIGMTSYLYILTFIHAYTKNQKYIYRLELKRAKNRNNFFGLFVRFVILYSKKRSLWYNT